MNIIDYCTQGGKNLITDYIDTLPPDERLRIYDIRFIIREKGLEAFQKLQTRPLRGKLWEIKI